MTRAFDVSSPDRNASLMEQFEIVLRRLCSSASDIDVSTGMRKRVVSVAPTLETGQVVSEEEKPTTIRKESNATIAPPNTASTPLTFAVAVQKFMTIYVIVGAAVSEFVSRHKDFVLVIGAPGMTVVMVRYVDLLTYVSSVDIFASEYVQLSQCDLPVIILQYDSIFWRTLFGHTYFR